MSPPPPSIRPAVHGDASALVDGNASMAAETEDKGLDRARLARGVRAVLDDPRRGFYLVAEREGRVVGQLMVTYEWSDWRNAPFWWVQSVHVEPAHRRTGVYRALHADVERRARAAGACGLRLYVERENGRAQSTYRALGMDETRYRLFEVEF